MYAPLVAKPKAVQLQRSMLRAQQSSQSSASQAHMIQPSLRQSGDAPGLAQRASAIRDAPDAHEKENYAARTAVHAAATLWDFSKIPIFSPDSTERLQNPPPFSAPRLPLPIQAKLKIGGANDPLEQEADSVAGKVMRMPNLAASTAAGLPQISPKCADCEEGEEKFQKKAAGPRGIAAEAPAIVHQVLGSPGQPLDAATR